MILVGLFECIYSHDQAVSGLELGLEPVGGAGDPPLKVPTLDPRDDTAEVIDFREDPLGLFFQLVGQALDEV